MVSDYFTKQLQGGLFRKLRAVIMILMWQATGITGVCWRSK
jgi:hypothetical protein